MSYLSISLELLDSILSYSPKYLNLSEMEPTKFNERQKKILSKKILQNKENKVTVTKISEINLLPDDVTILDSSQLEKSKNQEEKISKLPKKLKSFSFAFMRVPVGLFFDDIFKISEFPKKLKNLDITIRIQADSLIFELLRKNKTITKSRFYSYGDPGVYPKKCFFPSKLKELKTNYRISALFPKRLKILTAPMDFYSEEKFPSNLKKLSLIVLDKFSSSYDLSPVNEISNCNLQFNYLKKLKVLKITQHDYLIKNLPLNLRVFELIGGTSYSITNLLQSLKKIKKIKLEKISNYSHNLLNFPKSLKILIINMPCLLNLPNYSNHNKYNIVLPKNLKKINLNLRASKHPIKVKFNKKLRKVVLGRVDISIIEQLPDSVKIITLTFEFASHFSVEIKKYPKNLQTIFVNNNFQKESLKNVPANVNIIILKPH